MNLWNIFRKSKDRDMINIQSAEALGLLPSQVIYVEGKYNQAANDFIQENYGLIIRKFKAAPGGLSLIYFPKIEHDFASSQGELGGLVNYFFPYLKRRAMPERLIHTEGGPLSNLDLPTPLKSRRLFSMLGFKGKIKPGFLRLANDADASGAYTFEYFRLNLSRKKTLHKQIDAYLSHVPFTKETPDESLEIKDDKPKPCPPAEKKMMREDGIWNLLMLPEEEEPTPSPAKKKTIPSYRGGAFMEDLFKDEEPSTPPPERMLLERRISLPKQKDKPAADFFTLKKRDFYSKEYSIIENIKKDILELKKLGFYEHLIKEILEGIVSEGYAGNMESRLSRLVIDSDYNIYLPDYSSMEIRMTTLPKALFLLFLLHPEGIILKQLSDYEPELMRIYKIISNRENYEDMTGSIKRMCNPADKSINEKLSRIRESFAREMADNYAGYYYVTGERGEKKQIKLDRKLVSLPECFNRMK